MNNNYIIFLKTSIELDSFLEDAAIHEESDIVALAIKRNVNHKLFFCGKRL